MKKTINIVYLIINAIPWALRIIIGGLMAVGTLLLSLGGVVFSVWVIVESIIEGSQGIEYWGLALVAGIIFLIFAVGFLGFAIAFIAVFAGILIIYVTSYIVSLVYEFSTPKKRIPIPIWLFSLLNAFYFLLEMIFCVFCITGMLLETIYTGIFIGVGVLAVVDILYSGVSLAVFAFNLIYFIVNKKKEKELKNLRQITLE